MRSSRSDLAAGAAGGDNEISKLNDVSRLRLRGADDLRTPYVVNILAQPAEITRASGADRPQRLVRQGKTLAVAHLLTDAVPREPGNPFTKRRAVRQYVTESQIIVEPRWAWGWNISAA